MTTPGALTAGALAAIRQPVEWLVDSSRRTFQNPFSPVDWPDTVDPRSAWFFSPELSSLHGTELWHGLDDTQRHELTFLEALNFFSLNIHGERELIRGLAARLYRPDLVEVAPYLHHFIDEENKHSLYFGTFCRRYGHLYRSRQLGSGDVAPSADADLRFFTKVLVFEEIVDRLNLLQSKDERLHPVARFINHSHHADEARHLVFGRRVVEALWHAHAPTWSEAQIDDLRRYVEQFYVMAWREYYNPDVYRDAGLDAPWDVAQEAWDAAAQREHRRSVSRRSVRFLIDCGLLTEEPSEAF
jgi:hypothetical protein